MTYSQLKSKFPYIYAWHKSSGSYDYYIENLMRQAEADNAPTDAIYKRDEQWQIIEESRKIEFKQYLPK